MRRCRRVLDLLGDYLSEDLDARAHQFVRSHLADCPRCAAEFRASRALLSRLPSERAESAPPELKARLLASFRALRRPSPSFFRPGRLAWGLASTAASVAAAAALFWIAQPRTTPGGALGTQANLLPAPVPGLFHPRPAAPSPPSVASQEASSAPAAPRLAPVASSRVNRHSGGPRDNQPPPVEPPEGVTPAPAQQPSSPDAEEALVAPTPEGLDDATVVPDVE